MLNDGQVTSYVSTIVPYPGSPEGLDGGAGRSGDTEAGIPPRPDDGASVPGAPKNYFWQVMGL